MAAPEKLTPFTKENAKEMGARGGKTSGARRRSRRNMQMLLNAFVCKKVADEALAAELKSLGFTGDDITNGLAMINAMYKTVLDGNPKAFTALMDILGKELITGKPEQEAEDNRIIIEFADNGTTSGAADDLDRLTEDDGK